MSRKSIAIQADSSQGEVLALLDPLRDGRAAFRVGAFISGFLDGVEAERSKNDRLKLAFAAFSAQGGSMASSPAIS